MAHRLKAMSSPRYAQGFQLTLHPDQLEAPTRWRSPQLVFVNSMSDLFHPKVPLQFIEQVFAVMNRAPQHTFQVLTKRAHRLAQVAERLVWSPNIWMGVSIESTRYRYRSELLTSAVPAAVRFISAEPLLSNIPALPLAGIHQVIVGGESGPGARPMQESWVLELYAQCRAAGVAFFFKQWGGVNKAKTGRTLLGRTFDEMPVTSVCSGAI